MPSNWRTSDDESDPDSLGVAADDVCALSADDDDETDESGGDMDEGAGDVVGVGLLTDEDDTEVDAASAAARNESASPGLDGDVVSEDDDGGGDGTESSGGASQQRGTAGETDRRAGDRKRTEGRTDVSEFVRWACVCLCSLSKEGC